MEVNTKILQSALAVVGTQTDLITFRPDADGWYIYARGLNNSTLAEVRLGMGAFLDYAPAPEPFAVGTDDILKALKSMGKTFVLSTGPGGAGMFRMVSDGMTVSLPELAAELVDPRVPNLKRPDSAYARVPSAVFRKVIAAVDPKRVLQLRIALGPGGLTLTAADDSAAGASVSVPAAECADLRAPAVCTAAYSLETWTEFIKALPAGMDMDLQLASDYPAAVGFGDAGWSGRWVIAPQISDGEGA